MDDHARLDALRRLFAERPRRYFAPLASALRRAGDPAAAVALLRAHLAEQPEHLTGHVILAQALADAGDAAGAEAAYERAHAVDDGNVVALGALVGIARARGDAAAAAYWAERLELADPQPGGARRAPADAAAAPAAPDPSLEVFERLDFAPEAAPAAHEAEAGEPAPEDGDATGAASQGAPPATGGPGQYDPVVGLDAPPADPLPTPIREALPALAAEGERSAAVTEGGPSLGGVGAGAADPDDAGTAPPPAAPFVTETMAGLLAAQGHTAQALEVYAQLLAQRPDDARLRARVAELRGAADAAAAPLGGPPDGSAPPPHAEVSTGALPTTAPTPAAPAPAEPTAADAPTDFPMADEPRPGEPAPTPAPPPDARDVWAAEMWRAALAPLPLEASPVDAGGAVGSTDSALPRADTAEPGAAAPTAAADAADLDDLSFDRYFAAFGGGPAPAPAEPAGEFERWAAGLDAPAGVPGSSTSAAPQVAGVVGAGGMGDAPGGLNAPRPSPTPARDYQPDDPDADLAAFEAWLRGVDA